MRVLAHGDVAHGGAFTLAEFAGSTAGPWTVPHLHREMEESFYVLDGEFTFTVGEQPIQHCPARSSSFRAAHLTPSTLHAAVDGSSP